MKKVLCVFLLMVLMTSPAFAKAHLYTRHISGTKIENGEANYRDAQFERFKIEVWDDDTNAETPHSETGTLTLSGGSYTYVDAGVAQTVNNTEKVFELKDNSKSGGTLSYKLNGDFRDAADTGLNGVTAKWTFATSPDMDGEGVIPTFTSTEGQLKSVVPYVKLTYDSSNNVTAIHWAIVKSNDTGTPVAVDYASRIDVKVIDRDDNSTTLIKPKFEAGTVLSGDIELENVLAESSIEYFEISFRNRTDPNNLFSHEWRFFLPPYPSYLANQVHLWTRHISAAEIKNGEANYDNAAFERFKISVVNDDTATQEHVDATGTLTLSGGSYTYGGDTFNNTEKTFELKANMKVGDTLSYKPDDDFRGGADIGLNGVNATWTFDTMSDLNGSGTIPTFTSTENQLTTAVPYIKLTYNNSNQITAIDWAIVKASDTETPIAVDYNSRIVVKLEDQNENSTTLQNKIDFDAETKISGNIQLENALTEDDIQYIEVSFRNRSNAPYNFAHEWRFYTNNENTTHLWTRHISAATIKNGEANYDNAEFERLKIFITDDETVAEQAHLDATGTLTLSGGSYTYDGEEVNGTSKTFELEANMELEKNLDYKVSTDFYGAADTGLNGVEATWTFDSMSALNGNGKLPNFTSTENQLTTAVPYIKLTYDDSNQITAIDWAIVKASDTGTPIAVDYNSRIQIAVVDKNDNKDTLFKKTDFVAGTKLSGDLQLENALTEDEIQYIEFSFRNRADENNPFAQEWRFYTSNSNNSSGGGCNVGFMSVFALSLLGAVLLKKR